MTNAIRAIYENKLVGIIREDDKEKAIEIAKAYIEGGIKIIEMVAPIEAIKEVAKNENIFVARGGIITREQALDAISVGAKLLVSPILQMGLVKLSSSYKTPLILTATTPNEAYQAWKARVPLIKIFPSQQMGGAIYIQDLLRPMPFLNVIATGNVLLEDFHEYLEVGATAVTIGRDFWQYATYEDITSRAQAAVEKINAFKELKK